MALDEPKDGDAQHQVDGITFLVRPQDEQWVGTQRDVKVDHLGDRFGGGFYVATTLSGGCC